MSEGQSFKLMPYFVWKIKDVFSTVKLKSPIFTVSDVKFSMLFLQHGGKSTICMVPEVEHRQSLVAPYHIRASISIVDPDNSFKEFVFIQKTTNRNKTGLKASHLVWEVESAILDSLDVLQEENGKKSVRFLCVFGLLCEHQNDLAALKSSWKECHCMERLGKDLNDLRLRDSKAQLKCGDQTLNVHEVILSARSKQLVDEYRKGKAVGKAVDLGMEFEVLENFITYIYSGRLKDSKPSGKLLQQLYEAAQKYEMESLKLMTCFRLLEILYNKKLSGSLEEGKEILSGSLEEGKEILSGSLEEGKEILSDSLEEDKERVYDLSISLLLTADKYKDKNFKDYVVSSIINNNDFILRDEMWKRKFRAKLGPKLAMEVYDIVANEIKA